MWFFRIALSAGVLAAATQPANSQEAFECRTENGPALVFKIVHWAPDMTRETLIWFNRKTWTSLPDSPYSTREEIEGREVHLSPSQVFRAPDQIKFNVEEEFNRLGTIAEVRLFKAVEGGKAVYGGTLLMNGIGIWALRCEGAVGARL